VVESWPMSDRGVAEEWAGKAEKWPRSGKKVVEKRSRSGHGVTEELPWSGQGVAKERFHGSGCF